MRTKTERNLLRIQLCFSREEDDHFADAVYSGLGDVDPGLEPWTKRSRSEHRCSSSHRKSAGEGLLSVVLVFAVLHTTKLRSTSPSLSLNRSLS